MRVPALNPLAILVGAFGVWALHFFFIYGFAGWACERPSLAGGAAIMTAVGVATLVALVAFAGLAMMLLRRRPDAARLDRFRYAGALGVALAAVSTLWTAVPLLLLAPCP